MLGLEEKLFEDSIGNMKLDPYLTASSRTPAIELMNQLLEQNGYDIIKMATVGYF
jgi:hypothetical protein